MPVAIGRGPRPLGGYLFLKMEASREPVARFWGPLPWHRGTLAHACATSDNDDSSRPEIEPWHEQQSINQQSTIKASKTTKAGPRGGISKRIQEIY